MSKLKPINKPPEQEQILKRDKEEIMVIRVNNWVTSFWVHNVGGCYQEAWVLSEFRGADVDEERCGACAWGTEIEADFLERARNFGGTGASESLKPDNFGWAVATAAEAIAKFDNEPTTGIGTWFTVAGIDKDTGSEEPFEGSGNVETGGSKIGVGRAVGGVDPWMLWANWDRPRTEPPQFTDKISPGEINPGVEATDIAMSSNSEL